ncbi:MAG: hypothetical protein KJO82_04515 [Gammaproteobacteria bacterium]|nr:hypothetical protein [Gammaproteobacteria bacterium]
MRGFFEEIQRRNVVKVAIVYIIAGWLTMQVVDVMFPALKIPDWMTSAIAALLLIGFPFALIFAWAFEMTPEGIKREKDVDRGDSVAPETGRQLNQTALIILAVAVGFLLLDKFVLSRDDDPSPDTVADEVIATAKPSIAVLPFVNMSDDTDNEYFSDGLSEELLNVLAKIPQLHVAGRTSSFAFKGKHDDLRSIGEQLNVAHILEGSVRKSDSRLRITAQLIDTENGYHLWSETYDRELTDVFAIQDEISQAVVDALRVTLLGDVINTNYGTDNIEAYELYLKGRYLLEQTSGDNIRKSAEAIDRAIELDPGYAGAYVVRAIIEQQLISGWAGDGEDFVEGFARVRAYADKAIELDPESAEAHFVQGVVAATADWKLWAAAEHFARAIELNSNHIPARNWHANSLMLLGRAEEAVVEFQESLKLDPLMITTIRTLGDAQFFAGDSATAMDTYKSALELNPGLARIYSRMARVSIVNGDLEAAKAYIAKEEVDWVREFLDILILGREGKVDEWQNEVSAYQEKYGVLNAYQNACIYGDAGLIEEAFEWLYTARDVRDPGTVLARIDPLLMALRDDARWQPFLDSIGVSDQARIETAAIRHHAIVQPGDALAAGLLEGKRQYGVNRANKRGFE